MSHVMLSRAKSKKKNDISSTSGPEERNPGSTPRLFSCDNYCNAESSRAEQANAGPVRRLE